MSKLIALGNEVIEFPDTMSDSDIEKALQAQNQPASKSFGDYAADAGQGLLKGLQYAQKAGGLAVAKQIQPSLVALNALMGGKGNASLSGEEIKNALLNKNDFNLTNYIKRASGGPDWYAETAGTVGEMIADPLNLVPAEKAFKYIPGLKGGASLLEKGGKSLYKSAFKKLDEISTEFNKLPISEIMAKYGITGTAKTVRKKANELRDALMSKRNDIINKASDMSEGKKIINTQEVLKPVYDKALELAKNEDLASAALKEAKIIKKQMDKRLVSLKEAQTLKESVGMSTPKTAFDPEGTAAVTGILKKMRGGAYKTAIEDTASQIVPEAGDIIKTTNAEWSALKTAAKPLRNIAKSATNKNIFTSVDPLVATLGFGAGTSGGHGIEGALLAFAAKKAADLSKTMGFRTIAGKGLQEIPFSDALIRNVLAGYASESPYATLGRE